MKVAVLQPNFFPFKSYYDLVEKVDKVIFLDDVPYNNKSWANKTILKINSKDFYCRVPVNNNEEKILIKDIKIKSDKWKKSFLKMIRLQYRNTPNFPMVFSIIKEIINLPTDQMAHIAAYSVFRIANILNSKTDFSFSSINHGSIKGSAESKILNICKKEKADTYYTLYKDSIDEKLFLRNNVKVSRFISYHGKSSLLDDLMTNQSYGHLLKKEV